MLPVGFTRVLTLSHALTGQKKDWTRHRAECKQIKQQLNAGHPLHLAVALEKVMNDVPDLIFASPVWPKTVEISKIWPVLAWSAHSPAGQSDWPGVEALEHSVQRVETLPDGSTKFHLESDKLTSAEGWNAMLKDKTCSQFSQRLAYSGWALEKSLGVVAGLKQALQKEQQSLVYRGRDICDFGVTSGSYKPAAADQIHLRFADGREKPAQDSDNHFWIYFTTDQDTFFLDLSLIVWDVQVVVGCRPYLYHPVMIAREGPTGAYALAWGSDQVAQTGTPGLHVERPGESRFTVHRSEFAEACIDMITDLERDAPPGAVEFNSGPFQELLRRVRKHGPHPDGATEDASFTAYNQVFNLSSLLMVDMLQKKVHKAWPEQVPTLDVGAVFGKGKGRAP
jgi:hypothetical protein